VNVGDTGKQQQTTTETSRTKVWWNRCICKLTSERTCETVHRGLEVKVSEVDRWA